VRLQRIDAFRVYSILLIMFAHAQYFSAIDFSLPFTRAFSVIIIGIARPTIQFFFIASGFFLGGKILDDPQQAIPLAWKYTRRLLVVFLFWSIIYALVQPNEFLLLLEKDPVRLIFEGPKLHLWYLPSLILAIWLFALWPFDRKSWSFLAFGTVLFLVGLMGGAYRLTDIGVNLHFNTRDAAFFGTVFFGIGAYIHQKQPRVSKAAAVGIYLLGMAMYALESWYLWAQYNMDPIRNDYVLGSIPYGIGFFLLAYTFTANRLDRFAAKFAPYVLGIYVGHMLILDWLLKPLHKSFHPILWQLGLPFVLFVLSLGAVYLISKTPLKRVI